MTKYLNERAELETERLLLRPLAFDDVDDVLAYASDPGVARYLPQLPKPYTRSNAVEFIARQTLAQWPDEATFAIVLEQHVIGSVTLRIKDHDSGGLGYALARPHWGRGLMPEAARAVTDWGFEAHGLNKVYAFADIRNRQSWRVMEKLGMTREGVLRAHRKFGDEYVDDVFYGILRQEWQRAH